MSDQHIGIVWNPSKVDRTDLESALVTAFEGRDAPRVDYFETSTADPGGGAAKQALAAGVDLVIAAGGDGTVRAAAEHLARARSAAELGVVPLGTGNLLARNLEIPLGDIPAALTRALSGEARAIDVGWAEVALDEGSERNAFLVMAGFGVDAHMIDETDDDLKKKVGWVAYLEAMGRAVSASSPVDIELSTDGGTPVKETAHTLMVGNFGTVQGGVDLLPDASASDGSLDLLILGDDSATGWLDTIRNVAWDNGIKRLVSKKDGENETAVESDSTIRRSLTTLHVELAEPRMVQLDGDPIGETRSLTIETQPRAVRVRA